MTVDTTDSPPAADIAPPAPRWWVTLWSVWGFLVAGLIAIAVFGIALVRVFNSRVSPALDQLRLPAAVRVAVDRELPKLAGAQIDTPMEPAQRAGTQRVIDEAFVSAFRLVMIGASALALAAAAAGGLIREQPRSFASGQRASARPTETTPQ